MPIKKLVVCNWSDESDIRIIDESEAALYHEAFVFDVSCEPEIREIIRKRASLKKAYDDSMSLVYEYSNKLTREGRRR